ncbi:DUF4167 domain-containing protein [Nisaea nitritireducens]|uniref:DUF4167 domain-containing protein n=1 Tax=Nisaea nitritireducens TaxID=568392 RepID=UPI001868C115|nr:DUF4167 domain-containing protein [Nisaea nitritireducens]
MRQGPHQKRGRGRGGNNNRRPSTPNRNQTFDSNGPDVRIRGNAHQVFEKYLTLARDASTAGDRVLAESLFQHADHYFRIYSAFNEENEARKNAQQDTGQHQPDSQPRNDDSRRDDDSDAGNVVEVRPAQPPVAQPQPTSSSDDDEAPARRTRSERRQDAEAAEQTGEPEQPRAPRQPRRRRNGAAAPKDAAAPAADNDSALRAMLGASESGAPKAAAPEEAPAASAEPEAKPVRRRGRPRKVVEAVEPALPLAGED